MRITLAIILISFALVCTSCKEKAKSATMKANSVTRVFIEKMKKGETTREQEQAFIQVIGELTFELDRNLRGTEKATATRKAAEAIAKGIDPNAPFRIFDEEKENLKPESQPVTP